MSFQAQRVRRGLYDFALGKVVTGVLGATAMLLVVRGLEIPDFAAYSVLIALVEVVTALTGLGISHVVLRYVPELNAAGHYAAERALIWHAMALRLSVLLIVLTLCNWQLGSLALLLDLSAWVAELRLFLLLLAVRVMLHFVTQCLESSLNQRQVQISGAAGGAVRVALLVTTPLNLSAVIWIEMVGDAIALLIQLIALLREGRRSSGSTEGNAWVRMNFNRLVHFAWTGYLQHLAVLPYGGHANRLVGSRVLDVMGMAYLGFAQNLYEYTKRYLPAQLLMGLIRPVVIARYAEKRDFFAASQLCERALQVNLLMIAGLVVPMLVGGGDLLLVLSGGRYGDATLPVLTALAAVLTFETQRQQLELQAQLVERYDLLVSSNALLSTSVILGAFLATVVGPSGLPLASLTGLIAANSLVGRRLRKLGNHWQHDIGSVLGTGLIASLSVTVGFIVRWGGADWLAATIISMGVFFGMSWFFRRSLVSEFVQGLTGGGERLPKPDSTIEARETRPNTPAPVRIAFGVLSCRAESGAAIEALAHRLAPHPVWVHHDFAQCPTFACAATNVQVLRDPERTSWGDWSLVEATHRLMESALADEEVTHFVLLSEACLPMRPVAELADYLEQHRPFAMASWVPLQGDVAISHGWRYTARSVSVRRILRRCAVIVWGRRRRFVQVANINLALGTEPKSTIQILSGHVLKLASGTASRWFATRGLTQLAVGSQWLGFSRDAMTWLLAARRALPDVVSTFQASHIPDECYFQSLLATAQQHWPTLAFVPSLHGLFWRAAGSGPDQMTADTYSELRRSGVFFARKFALSEHDSLRQTALQAVQAVHAVQCDVRTET